MMELIDDLCNQAYSNGKDEGFLSGKLQKAQQVARNLYKLGMDIGQISKIVGYSVVMVKQWFGLAKKGEKDTVDMCKAIQDMCDEAKAEGIILGRAEGRAEGEIYKAHETAKNLHAMGFDIEQIAQGVDCTAETVKQWLEIS